MISHSIMGKLFRKLRRFLGLLLARMKLKYRRSGSGFRVRAWIKGAAWGERLLFLRLPTLQGLSLLSRVIRKIENSWAVACWAVTRLSITSFVKHSRYVAYSCGSKSQTKTWNDVQSGKKCDFNKDSFSKSLIKRSKDSDKISKYEIYCLIENILVHGNRDDFNWKRSS